MPTSAYRDSTRPIPERVEDLLSQMTLGEKVAQLSATLGWPAYRRNGADVELTEEGRAWLSGDGVGGLYGLLRADPWTGVTAKTGLSPEEGARVVEMVEGFNRENTRLGIPVFVIAEANHGYMALGGTLGPSLLTASQSWNPALWRRFMVGASREMRAQGNSVAFCPNVDLGLDPRWGRCEETTSEDPHLASQFAKAAILGLQGDTLGGASIAACVKHFVHGSPEAGLNTHSAHMGRHELHERFLRPFRTAIAAGAAGVMPSYNEIDGEPCSGNRWLLTELLRGQLGFEGVTFSDVAAIGMLASPFRRVADYPEAAALAMGAGIDFESAQTRLYDQPLKEAIEAGLVQLEWVDRSVRRVLKLKFELGLFDQRTSNPVWAKQWMGCEEHRQLALDLARQSVVLLKNEGILPLPKSLTSLAVIGPNADNIYNQLGDYSAPQRPGETVTILAGLRAALPDTRIEYVKGCAIRDPSATNFEEAVRVAEVCDATVLVLGGSSARDFELEDLSTPELGAMTAERTSKDIECGEGLDRRTLELLGDQNELAMRVLETGKPVVIVLIGGRPMVLGQMGDKAPAILFAGYPGQEGGRAIAEILLGDTNPSGRLTMTWPKSVGQLPLHYNSKPNVGNSYVDGNDQPAFAFGHGLSYGKFEYRDLKVQVLDGANVEVTVSVRNISERAGEEVAQLYLRDEISSLTRPERELKGFKRVRLGARGEQEVRFHLGPEELGFYDADGRLRVEVGSFTAFVGGSLQADLFVYFELNRIGSAATIGS